MKKIISLLVLGLCMGCSSDLSEPSATDGTLSGSYANILAIGDYLYIVSTSEIITYSIEDAALPSEVDRAELGFGIESLFYRKGNLYIGSNTTMYIYAIGSNGVPERLSTTDYSVFQGACTRDPIVTNDSIAYVTLSTTIVGDCFREDLNELRLYDITEINQPSLISQIDLLEPKGLGLDDEWLFICERNNGVKVFDVSDSQDVVLVHHFDGFESFDVIANDGLLLVIGPDNLYQFDYSNMATMHLISTLEI